MSVWRDIDKLPRARWQEANLAHTFTLPRPVSYQQLCQALTAVDAKHESLRTVYDVSDPVNPRQRPLPAQQFSQVEVAAAGRDDIEARVSALVATPFDLTTDRTLRALAIADGGEQADLIELQAEPVITRLALCLHHLSADGFSVGLIWMDLLALLGIAGSPLPVPPNSLSEVAIEQRTGESWQKKLRASQRHFRAVYQANVAEFADRDGDRGAVQAALESHQLADTAQRLADDHKVSVATVFTAAFLDAIVPHCWPGPIRIGLMTSNRFLQRWHHQVTTMNQLIPIVADADPAADFGARLADIQLATMRAYRLGLFDVDAVTPAALGLDLQPSEVGALCMFNIVEGAGAEYDDPDDPLAPQVHWEPVFTTIRAGCYLRAFRTVDHSIRLRLRTGGLTNDTCASILTDTYLRIMRAAA
ncbi:MAG: condensation domain-containing protein [Jatrophihabitantaceae bacterium]